MSLAKTQRSPRAENSASSVVCHPSSLLCALGVLARAGFWLRPKAALGNSCHLLFLCPLYLGTYAVTATAVPEKGT